MFFSTIKDYFHFNIEKEYLDVFAIILSFIISALCYIL